MAAFSQPAHAQNVRPCVEIDVKVNVVGLPDAKSEVSLEFKDNQQVRNFTLSVFGPNRLQRLDLAASEKLELPKGKYILIVQSKNYESLCTKQINLKLE